MSLINHAARKTAKKHKAHICLLWWLGGIFALPMPVTANPEPLNENSMAQITSVEQLTDVQSTDWAFQALRSLVERYRLLSGFPDGTFRGNSSLTRYEFAAILAQAIEQFNLAIASSVQFSQEDIITLQRLQRDYRAALAELSDRADGISTRLTRLEDIQFSATTKLQGEVIIALTDGDQANRTVVNRQRLTFLTSFTRQDLLLTQLEAGNNGADAIFLAQNQGQNLLGTTGVLADGGGLEYAEISNNLRLRRLYYTFHPSSDLAVTIGAKMPPKDFIDRNRYANDETVDFSGSFFLNNPLIVQNQIDRDSGAGAAIAWNINGGDFTVRSLYIAADANQPSVSNEGGLFGDRYQASVELEYLPNPQFAVRLQYTNALINNTAIDAVGINAEYALTRTTALFGRFGIGSYQGFNTAIAENLDLHPHTWAIGLALDDLFIPGTLAGVAIGQPFVENDLGDATQTNIEAFYNFQLSDNISITPTFAIVANANNNRDADTIWQATLRTSFKF